MGGAERIKPTIIRIKRGDQKKARKEMSASMQRLAGKVAVTYRAGKVKIVDPYMVMAEALKTPSSMAGSGNLRGGKRRKK
ncbi:MAG: hypothetical protein ABII97_00965 [Patescibacteria group bacterium]